MSSYLLSCLVSIVPYSPISFLTHKLHSLSYSRYIDMPRHDVPLSLEELIALKNKGKKSTNNKHKGPAKTKFLTKYQRDKLEQEKLKPKTDEPVKPKSLNTQSNTIQSFIDDPEDTEIEKDVDTSNKNNNNDRKRPANGKFKFGWNDSEDTSQNEFLKIKDTYDYSLELPYRKKRGTDNDYSGVYWAKKPLDKMTDRDWRIFKEDFDISVKGNMKENMIRYWNESKIPNEVASQLTRLRYNEPTPIQRATIPLGLKGKDVVGIAETGSGKTLAFLIPAISYVMRLPPVRPFESPYVLIVVPTRELAQQIETECQKFMNHIHFNVASIVGGRSYDENITKLEKGVEILIGTPGRLLDLLEKKIVALDRCFFLIADEADIMIDMGFEKQIHNLLEQLPTGDTNPFAIFEGNPKRTTMMFTATLPPSIEKIMSNYLLNPITVTVGNTENAVETVVQDAIQVPNDDNKKMSILRNILTDRIRYLPPIIIFVNYRKTCDMLFDFLTTLNFQVATIHGSKNQQQREDAINRMKTGDADILIATDVAARGIDIANVSLVINYHMTKSISEYVHRIGRTGRAGRSGKSITFWNPEVDTDVLFDLKSMIVNSKISNCPNDLKKHEFAQSKQFKNIEY